jgi:hypothetical protein
LNSIAPSLLKAMPPPLQIKQSSLLCGIVVDVGVKLLIGLAEYCNEVSKEE